MMGQIAFGVYESLNWVYVFLSSLIIDSNICPVYNLSSLSDLSGKMGNVISKMAE